MARDYYTLLLIPQKKEAIRKIKLSSALLRFICIVISLSVVSILYFSFNYIKIRGDAGELSKLRHLTTIQKEQIDLLASKIVSFEKKMADIKQFDQKIRIMTNIENGRDGGQFLGMGGPVPEESVVESHLAETERALIDNIHKNMNQLLEEANYQEDSFRELYEFLKKQKSILASTPSIWPVMGWVTSEFGYRISPFTGKREFHRGIDVATKMGEDIVSPADGIVANLTKTSDMGNMLRIDHGNGISTYYGHLSKITVKNGARVTRGQVIGQIGNSGRSTGPHLHYGVRLNGVYVNPRKYLF
jgi:murein DD-endopeptidase MepM/ murein hydrolase activator NlpD